MMIYKFQVVRRRGDMCPDSLLSYSIVPVLLLLGVDEARSYI